MNELTPMQAACWFGRNMKGALGGVAAHLYAEFDGQGIEVERLKQALGHVYSLHPMLRLRIDAEGFQSVMPFSKPPVLEIDDFRHALAQETTQRLLAKRQQWTHQKLDLAAGQTARFSLSLLNDGGFRLHIDTDMIAIDPSSFRVLIEDLAAFYHQPERPVPALASYFDWCEQVRSDPDLNAARAADRLYWRARIPAIPPAPTLPFPQKLPEQAQSHRLATWLVPSEHHALKRLARTHSITLSTLMLGLFSLVLAQHTGDRRFRLNVPMFWRNPLVENVERLVGDFANVLILGVEIDGAESPAALCARLGEQVSDLLAHSAYPGVNLMRDLSRHHGGTQLAPVVVTAALDVSGGELLSARVKRTFGSMNWVISQGPQVALDAQFVAVDGGVLINWDIRLDALPEAWISAMFDSFVDFVRDIAAHPQRFDQVMPLGDTHRPTVLPARQDSATKNKVLAIYLAELAPARPGTLDSASDLISLGLRPRHLKSISARLRDEFGVALSLPQLLRCRNAAEVAQLLHADAQRTH